MHLVKQKRIHHLVLVWYSSALGRITAEKLTQDRRRLEQRLGTRPL
jgi:hypothetical protein